MSHAYVDESDRGDYLVCAAVVSPPDADDIRRALRGLRRRGASRLHMAKESIEHRKVILSAICALPVAATIYVSRYPVNRDGRAEIMRHIVDTLSIDRLVIESAAGQDERDRAVLFDAVRKAGLEGGFSYLHAAPKTEPLLWLPDAVAWAWGAGKDWRRRIRPVVVEVVVLEP